MSKIDKSYISPSIVIQSMRDNGYKDTAYAIAELIDNSIQAGANCVRVACFEKRKLSSKSQKLFLEIDEIAILDDGYGMAKDVLHLALEFGASINKKDKSGMGKFGMGLPNSSVSQCQLTEVWSWRKGEKPLYTYLDVQKIKNKDVENIPEPIELDIPSHIIAAYGILPESGTIVRWSELDKLSWKTSRSIRVHTESLIGRVYRRYLSKQSSYNQGKRDPLRIAFQTFEFKDAINQYEGIDTIDLKPNDPMYLYADTNMEPLPNKLGNIGAFEIFYEDKYPITLENGEVSNVIVRTTTLKKDVADALKGTITKGKMIGNTVWGKHTQKNIGLSVIRAHRELELIPNYYIADRNYLDRWVGAEIEFDPILDEFFGVTNNKQTATKIKYIPISTLAAEIIDVEGEESLADLEEKYLNYLADEAPLDLQIVKLNEFVKIKMAEAVKAIEKLGYEGTLTSIKHEESSSITTDSVNISASLADRQRDQDECDPEKDKQPDLEKIKNHLIQEGLPEQEVDRTINEIIQNNLSVKFDFRPGYEEFFDVTTFQGFTLIRINTDHTFYKAFMKEASSQERDLLNLCLAAWARMEKEASENLQKDFARARRFWGKMLESYLGPMCKNDE